MLDLYEKQEDGSLKQIGYPEQLVKKVAIYRWLMSQWLSFDEIV